MTLLLLREEAKFQNLVFSKNLLIIYWEHVSSASFGRTNELIQLFHFVANGFHGFENNCFRKIQSTTKFCNFFSFFVYVLPIPINERSYTTILALEEGSFKHNLRGKMWLYVFDNVFSQYLIGFLFIVSICCSFCNCIKISIMQVLMPSYRFVWGHKHVGCFKLLSNGFH